MRRAGPKSFASKMLQSANPGEGEVRVRHVAVGLNFADTYFRQGYYPVPLPNGMGVEGSGVIEAVGPQHERLQGRRPRHLHRQSARRLFDRAGHADRVPDQAARSTSTHETAAAMTMRGLSAAYWLLKTNPWMKAGDTILLHAAAGGVGLIASQWAKLLGLRVIGTVSTEAKAAAREGTWLRRDHLLPRRRRRRRGPRADRRRRRDDRVRHGRARTRSKRSLKSLKRRGVLVGCGTASGPFPPIDALQMAIQGSVYFTRPALADYIADPAERAELADSPVRPCRQRPHQDRDQPALRAGRRRRRRTGTSRQGRRPARRSS